MVVRKSQPTVEATVNTPEATPTVATEVDSAQSLPIDLPVNKPAVLKQAATSTKVRRKVDDIGVSVSSEMTIPVEREVVTPVVQPVAVPVMAEVRPKVADPTPVAQPVESQPVVQPTPVAAVTAPLSTSVPMPITASAAPVPKRKSKNDEDVEIDFK